jgi:hypothetical protein
LPASIGYGKDQTDRTSKDLGLIDQVEYLKTFVEEKGKRKTWREDLGRL